MKCATYSLLHLPVALISVSERHLLCFQKWWKVTGQKLSLIIVSGYWEFICHLHWWLRFTVCQSPVFPLSKHTMCEPLIWPHHQWQHSMPFSSKTYCQMNIRMKQSEVAFEHVSATETKGDPASRFSACERYLNCTPRTQYKSPALSFPVISEGSTNPD